MEKTELARIAENTLRNLRDLIEEQHVWAEAGMEDQSPFGDFLDGVLAIDRVVKQPLFGGGETLLHWEVLLGFGGPDVRLEIDDSGSGRVVVAWWSAPYHLTFDGVLRELGEELSAYDDAMFGG